MTERRFMERALFLAEKAAQQGDVPVGAVIVCDGEIIAEGYNTREKDRNALSHAEIIAINEACKAKNSWRLSDCELYVTLEPCPMCAGAIINARVGKVIFGAYDEKAGCLGSKENFCEKGFNHKPAVMGGYMEKQCREILQSFFSKRR